MDAQDQYYCRISIIDILVFISENLRFFIAVTFSAVFITYCALFFVTEKYTASFRLELPPSVHPFVADPIFLAAMRNNGPANVNFEDGTLHWSAIAQSRDAAESLVKLARNSALDAVSDLDPANLSRGWNDPSLFTINLVEQVSTVKRWAALMKTKPISIESNRKPALWLFGSALFSLVAAVVFKACYKLLEAVKRTPEGAQKVARIKSGLLLRKARKG